MVEKNFANGYSKGNKDKYDNVRLETSSINKIVITYSVCDGDLSKALSTLHQLLSAKADSLGLRL